jgi:hypothetical protein
MAAIKTPDVSRYINPAFEIAASSGELWVVAALSILLAYVVMLYVFVALPLLGLWHAIKWVLSPQ